MRVETEGHSTGDVTERVYVAPVVMLAVFHETSRKAKDGTEEIELRLKFPEWGQDIAAVDRVSGESAEFVAGARDRALGDLEMALTAKLQSEMGLTHGRKTVYQREAAGERVKGNQGGACSGGSSPTASTPR